jgi:hypothetical protein
VIGDFAQLGTSDPCIGLTRRPTDQDINGTINRVQAKLRDKFFRVGSQHIARACMRCELVFPEVTVEILCVRLLLMLEAVTTDLVSPSA